MAQYNPYPVSGRGYGQMNPYQGYGGMPDPYQQQGYGGYGGGNVPPAGGMQNPYQMGQQGYGGGGMPDIMSMLGMFGQGGGMQNPYQSQGYGGMGQPSNMNDILGMLLGQTDGQGAQGAFPPPLYWPQGGYGYLNYSLYNQLPMPTPWGGGFGTGGFEWPDWVGYELSKPGGNWEEKQYALNFMNQMFPYMQQAQEQYMNKQEFDEAMRRWQTETSWNALKDVWGMQQQGTQFGEDVRRYDLNRLMQESGITGLYNSQPTLPYRDWLAEMSGMYTDPRSGMSAPTQEYKRYLDQQKAQQMAMQFQSLGMQGQVPTFDWRTGRYTGEAPTLENLTTQANQIGYWGTQPTLSRLSFLEQQRQNQALEDMQKNLREQQYRMGQAGSTGIWYDPSTGSQAWSLEKQALQAALGGKYQGQESFPFQQWVTQQFGYRPDAAGGKEYSLPYQQWQTEAARLQEQANRQWDATLAGITGMYGTDPTFEARQWDFTSALASQQMELARQQQEWAQQTQFPHQQTLQLAELTGKYGGAPTFEREQWQYASQLAQEQQQLAQQRQQWEMTTQFPEQQALQKELASWQTFGRRNAPNFKWM